MSLHLSWHRSWYHGSPGFVLVPHGWEPNYPSEPTSGIDLMPNEGGGKGGWGKCCEQVRTVNIWRLPEIGLLPNGWCFLGEIPWKFRWWLGVPLFQKTPICKHLRMDVHSVCGFLFSWVKLNKPNIKPWGLVHRPHHTWWSIRRIMPEIVLHLRCNQLRFGVSQVGRFGHSQSSFLT